MYVGGAFTTIGGQSRSRLAALSATTGLATAWDPSADNAVLTMVASCLTLHVGGYFKSIGGQDRQGIAAVSIPDTPVPTLLTFDAEQTSTGVQLR